MSRPLYATLVVICLASGTAAFSQAEKSITAEWVPFVAKWVQTTELEGAGQTYTIALSGMFVRDKEGSWFRRGTVGSSLAILHSSGQTDTATLFDRVNQKLYLLDFTRKTVKPLEVSASVQPWFGGSPMSAQAFGQYHSDDKFLGNQIISGVECEGYAIHDPRHKGKFVSEVWYAPSLNYLAIDAKSRDLGGHKVTTRVENIQIGKEPDPQYFRLPDGFKMIK